MDSTSSNQKNQLLILIFWVCGEIEPDVFLTAFISYPAFQCLTSTALGFICLCTKYK